MPALSTIFMTDDAKDTEKKLFNAFRERRRKMKKHYGSLFRQVAEILNRHDTVYLIRHGAPPDEYEGETSRILPQLKNAKSVSEARNIIYDVFDQSFNYGYAASDLSKKIKVCDGEAGNETDYQLIAEEIWMVWETFNLRVIKE